MEINLLKEVIACLDNGRRLLHYFKDRYALYLLESLFTTETQIPMAKVRESDFNKLLNKDVIKKATARCGNGFLDSNRLKEIFLMDYQSYVLTLSEWGSKNQYSWAQTSRPGANLVLQLNFSNEHEQLMSRYKIKGDRFKYYEHPIHDLKSSVAWARIDIDFQTGEALIEEVQNDWLRIAHSLNRFSSRKLKQGELTYQWGGLTLRNIDMLNYTTILLKQYSKVWSETMLFSAISTIKEELGLDKIFYHTVETGKWLKNISYGAPPVSIYSDLPRKFCFKTVNSAPEFIATNRAARRRLKKVKQPSWFYLEI